MFLLMSMEELARAQRPEGRLEERLLPLVGQGDPEAFEVLYRSTEKAVYALALSILRNPHDAEDIVQETYLKVRAAAHLYVPQGKPLAWLFTITKNLCRDLLRGQSRTEAALKALGEEERQVVLLHAASGLKHREIARDLGLPLSTVLSRYSRALKKLQRYLTEEGVHL